MTIETALRSHRSAQGSCRLCGAGVEHTFVDLGMSPLCESFLRREQLDAMEPYFPLHALVCGRCFLVQLKEYVSPEHIFREYAYFSSYSTSWVAHAKRYCEAITKRLGLGANSLAVELASNDGCWDIGTSPPMPRSAGRSSRPSASCCRC